MTISELKAVLERAAQVAGDAEVIIRHVEQDIGTVFHGVSVTIPADTGQPATVAIVHGPAPESAPVSDGADDAPQPAAPGV